MKTVSYKDPYEPIPVVIQIEDEDEEGFQKALEFLNENTRIIQNAERKERYHTAYHTDGLTYEVLKKAYWMMKMKTFCIHRRVTTHVESVVLLTKVHK